MAWLLDTRLLVRYADSTAAQHQIARLAIEALIGRGEDIYLTSQNLIEFWAVATRPIEANGLGWSVADTEGRISSLKLRFPSSAQMRHRFSRFGFSWFPPSESPERGFTMRSWLGTRHRQLADI